MLFDEKIDADGPAAPWMQKKILAGGASWGVSHTRVPTESRPCHASLLGGIYEDPSAVTKGWQQNPVEFDTVGQGGTVLNASSASFAIGSPDVIPLFAKGIPHVTSLRLKGAGVQASSRDEVLNTLTRLDDWVFAKLEELLKNATSDKGLNHRLRQDKMIIFLHLLGLDMNGHAHRPASQQYKDNLRSVDEGVKKVEQLLDNFFHRDGKTAYLFTSDHGMSNKGSHGDGEAECTQTPLVMWGAGVSRTSARKSVAPGHEDKHANPKTPEAWGKLKYVERKDLQQAQIAPLISVLIGAQLPRNSIGILPLQYLDLSPQDPRRLLLLLANAKVMHAQLKRKEEEKRQSSFSLLFKQYRPIRDGSIQRAIEECEEGARERRADLPQLEAEVHRVIQLLLQGLLYYDTYDRHFLQLFLSSSILLGWGTAYVLLSINYESCFYVALCWQLQLWLEIESSVPRSKEKRLEHRDLATAIMLLFLTIASFFGTGNIASVSSFELKSVYRFLTVFDPFLMGGMLLFKIVLPFVLVTATFSLICSRQGVSTAGVLCLVLVLAVRTEGSWKEIGNSISHFGITNFVIVMIQANFIHCNPLLVLGDSHVACR
ncbi:hypothetical protein GUITHDRAFT_141776 [Guillardia theta CCMP2712]|uniref:GPI ethanolamine phosphate transferase 1 n=2 Tax=Guillardia theta TaxID=55529 RepID=L1IZV6_GUITC|nr:hypothetical protein GUITHDRAFT_141776 [Guillardia theta CCMP2712]EKX41788.1 hypothetical protein GUITHDRAFT_141776 [Guillardia theta CCMP2712]|eukprot:XP_005828768.1 hypothetical protein GUITHDRAFT_141776 [Guillardia theta CCMP2712]